MKNLLIYSLAFVTALALTLPMISAASDERVVEKQDIYSLTAVTSELQGDE